MIRLFPSSLPPWHQSLLLQGIDTKELDLIATGDGGFVMMENTFPGKQFAAFQSRQGSQFCMGSEKQ